MCTDIVVRFRTNRGLQSFKYVAPAAESTLTHALHTVSRRHSFLNAALKAAASMKKPHSLNEKASKNCAGGVPEGKPYPNQSALCNAADQDS